MRPTHSFVDLEDTVITPAVPSFAACELLPANIHFIRNFFTDREIPVASWNIFSFALHNEGDLRNFEATNTRSWIEERMGVQFSRIPLLGTDIKRACCRQMRLTESCVDTQEVINFWGKQVAFQHWVVDNKRAFAGSDIFLFDDVVMNNTLTMSDFDITINFVKI